MLVLTRYPGEKTYIGSDIEVVIDAVDGNKVRVGVGTSERDWFISRTPGEKFFITDDVEMEVVSVEARKVRIGITAPKNIPIIRDNAIVKHPKGVPNG